LYRILNHKKLTNLLKTRQFFGRLLAQFRVQIHTVDIETCPDCGGTLRVIACIEDPPLIAKILGHVRSREAGAAAQARAAPADSQQRLKLL
jgi:hypothetical protein